MNIKTLENLKTSLEGTSGSRQINPLMTRSFKLLGEGAL